MQTSGFLPDELAFLCDLSILHLNNDCFCGIIPETFTGLTHLSELDLANNRFVGPFPSVVLSLPSLAYLDLRYNEFEGLLPSQLFEKHFDTFFSTTIASGVLSLWNLGKSKASVMVFANDKLGGCLPESIVNFVDMLEELLLINTSISGCLPIQVGFLYKLRVLDVSFNNIVGPIPYSLSGLSHLEQLNIGHNMMSGIVPMGVCALPNLVNFTFSYNFFCEEEGICKNLTSRKIVYDDRRNCLPNKALQRSEKECKTKLEQPPVDCFEVCCVESGFGKNVSVGSVAVSPSAIPVAAMPVSPPVVAPRYP